MMDTQTPELLPEAANKEVEEEEEVLKDLQSYLSRVEPISLFDKSATAVSVAAIRALLGVVQRTKAETMMGLQHELQYSTELMTEKFPGTFALRSGCSLFLKYVTRTFLDYDDFETCRQAIIQRGTRFESMSLAARDRIALLAADFIPNNATILTHGFARNVAAILGHAASDRHKNFDVIILEGRPDASGAKAAQCYRQEANINVKVILDAAMGYIMESVDLVLVGAQGVLENGGIVNKIGTAALAAVAQAHGKPFYVASESYKFTRLYPLSQADLPPHENAKFECFDTLQRKNGTNEARKVELGDSIQTENPPVDFTPAKFITLLFTDLGVLTPSAVSDELIRLYQ